MKKKKIFCFDIDNVICKTTGGDYKNSIPNKKSINLINDLFENGHIIKIFTARYMSRYKDNVKLVNKAGYKSTNKQLKKWGLKYHKLIMGKTSYDILIDDKAFGYKNNWVNFFKKRLKLK